MRMMLAVPVARGRATVRHSPAAGAVALALLLGVAACGGDDPAAGPATDDGAAAATGAGSDGELDADDGGAADDGATDAATDEDLDLPDAPIGRTDAPLPAGFPDLPLSPPGAVVSHAEAYDAGFGEEFHADLIVAEGGPEAFRAAVDHYRTALPAAGWVLVDEDVRDGAEAWLWFEGDGFEASINVEDDMGSVWISVSFSPPLSWDEP